MGVRISFLLALTLLGSSMAVKNHFMDCPGNDNILGIMRRCCNSDELPKGCECFDISSLTGFTNTAFMKPQCPSKISPVFKVYTRSNRNSGSRIRTGEQNIKSTPFKASKDTFFIAHGFTDFGGAPWMLEMKNALLDKGDFNVILVDWKNGAKAPNYYQAAANTRTVGAMIGRLVQDIHTYKHTAYNNFHLIGHSLGSHMMGYAGQEVLRLTGSKIGRITGLDPAGPKFEKYTDFVRLDKSDARFVDILHTDAESLVDAGFGIRVSTGHADFYPNGGTNQPGCPPGAHGLLSMTDFEDEINTGACSHSRALHFFTNSISKCRFDSPTGGSKCTMGFHVSDSCRGDHYPKTGSKQPFC